MMEHLLASEEMLKHVNGKGRFDDEGERRKKEVPLPATDKPPVPTPIEVRLRIEFPSIAGISKHLAVAPHSDAISLSRTETLRLRVSTLIYSLLFFLIIFNYC